MKNKDHVLGVERKECAVVRGQDGHRIMVVTELLELLIMCAP